MKRITFSSLFILSVSLFITACKDDPEPSLSGEMVLSKVFLDGKLEREYLYNADKQLEQIRDYDTPSGELGYYATNFEYDNRGFLHNTTNYNTSGKATSIWQYLKDSEGKFISSDFISLTGADSGEVITRNKYQYNKTGYISKQAWHDPDTDAEESYNVFFYYPNGNLERIEYYWTVEPSPEKVYEIRYTPAGQPLFENIKKRQGYLINFDFLLLVAEQIEYETFDTARPTNEYHEVISGRMYNSQGFITEQTITYKYIVPEEPDKVVHMKYEYTEI